MDRVKRIKNILLIDDDYPTNYLHKIILMDTGHIDNIHDCTSVDDGINFLKEKFEENQSPELIFIDINLPAKNGFDFIEEFDALDSELKSKSIVIMFSTSENPRDLEKSKQYSTIQDMLLKPLNEEIIFYLIEKFF